MTLNVSKMRKAFIHRFVLKTELFATIAVSEIEIVVHQIDLKVFTIDQIKFVQSKSNSCKKNMQFFSIDINIL